MPVSMEQLRLGWTTGNMLNRGKKSEGIPIFSERSTRSSPGLHIEPRFLWKMLRCLYQPRLFHLINNSMSLPWVFLGWPKAWADREEKWRSHPHQCYTRNILLFSLLHSWKFCPHNIQSHLSNIVRILRPQSTLLLLVASDEVLLKLPCFPMRIADCTRWWGSDPAEICTDGWSEMFPIESCRTAGALGLCCSSLQWLNSDCNIL